MTTTTGSIPDLCLLPGAAPIPVKVKRLHAGAILPTYATEGSMCFDLYAPLEAAHLRGRDTYVTPDAPTVEVRLGLAFELPPGWGMNIFSRSGHGRDYDTRLVNCVGKVDCDYRGELVVHLRNDGGRFGSTLTIRGGDRIAQAEIVPIYRATFYEVDELSPTVRGDGGFGSTGR